MCSSRCELKKRSGILTETTSIINSLKKIQTMNEHKPYEDNEIDDFRLTEDPDDLGEDHRLDQLPSVEQIRANRHLEGIKGTKSSSKKRLYRMTCIIGTMLLFLGVVVAFTKNNKFLKQPSEEELAIEFLTNNNISNIQVLRDAQTPQFLALQWMIHENALPYTMPTMVNDSFVQRYLVAVFCFSLCPWLQDNNQLPILASDTHECDWSSNWQRKDGETMKLGVGCNVQKQVTKLVFPTLGLNGTLPDELSLLPNLEQLILDVNHIAGTVPVISSLVHLSISHNHLEGTIPLTIGSNMNSLQVFDVSYNNLQGTVPPSMNQLTNLKFLSFSGNSISGSIYPMMNLASLEELYLGYNKFSSNLSGDSFRLLTNLRVLAANDNKLLGPVPDVLWNLTQLEVVDLHFNGLEGRIDGFPHVHSIQYLDLASNLLFGGIPSNVGNLAKLTYLDLSSNRFDELLPETMSDLTDLETLMLTDNSKFGPQPIPQWLVHMSSLKQLSLKRTSRSGTIPDWFYKLTQLRLIDMDSNRISGTISTQFGRFQNLEYLLMNRNWLNGTIPTELSGLPNLQMLMADNNNFEGALDDCQIPIITADCGDPDDGCPNCASDTQKVSCPCCEICCFDSINDEACNTRDWLSELPNQEQWHDYKHQLYLWNFGETMKPMRT